MTESACFRRLLLLGFGLLLAGLVVQAQARTVELREALATVTVQGQTTTQPVRLPYHWDRHHQGLAGEAVFEFPFQLQEIPTELYALYLPRLGNAYEIWLNGTLLQRNGDMLHDNGSDYAKAPRLVEISPGLLRIHNLFRIRIRTDVGRRGGLASLILGPDEEVYPLYLHDYHSRITGSLVVVVGSLLIGLVALALWATQVDTAMPAQPRRDPLYLLAGLAELCWMVSVSDFITENPPLPWPWWGMVPIMMTSVWTCGVILFSVEAVGWGRLPAATWLRRWLGLLMAACVAAAIAAFAYGYPGPLTIVYAFSGLTFVMFVALVGWTAMRGGALVTKMLAVVLLLNTVVGCYDLYVMQLSTAYEDSTYLRYFSMLFGLTLLYIVITRFRLASVQASDLNANLAERVAQKEQELAQTYRRVEQLAREQERTAERTRILRDMHDGVGSHISTAIRQLESGRASQGDVLHTLRDSLDQLKLSIDAMNLPLGDITALLANLRYRLEPRFKASDIELQWDVDLLPPLARLDDKAMRHLQFMVFESLSNVLQHARASVLRIELRSTQQGGAQLLVIDNGCGFEPDRVKHRGLSSLRERAAAIGAGLLIASDPGHTVVEIILD